jgi:hypothetical protein
MNKTCSNNLIDNRRKVIQINIRQSQRIANRRKGADMHAIRDRQRKAGGNSQCCTKIEMVNVFKMETVNVEKMEIANVVKTEIANKIENGLR